jgi:hypothetical protein
MTGSARFQSGLEKLLGGEFDDDFPSPAEVVVTAAARMVEEAMGDGECPEFHLSTIGDGGVRLHCGAAPGRQFILSMSPDTEDGMPRPPHIFHDGDGVHGLVWDVDVDELRRRFEWVGGKWSTTHG